MHAFWVVGALIGLVHPLELCQRGCVTFESVSDALRRYEDVLMRRGVPDDHFAPGLSASELDDIEREAGFRFSEDVRAVWSWHNGVADTKAPFITGRSLFTPFHALVDLQDAVRRAVVVVRAAEEAGDVETGVNHWVELCTGNDPFVIDSTDPEAADSPTLGLVFGEGVNLIPHISVTERVELWIEAFETGVWTIDADGRWHDNYGLRTPRMIELL